MQSRPGPKNQAQGDRKSRRQRQKKPGKSEPRKAQTAPETRPKTREDPEPEPEKTREPEKRESGEESEGARAKNHSQLREARERLGWAGQTAGTGSEGGRGSSRGNMHPWAAVDDADEGVHGAHSGPGGGRRRHGRGSALHIAPEALCGSVASGGDSSLTLRDASRPARAAPLRPRARPRAGRTGARWRA